MLLEVPKLRVLLLGRLPPPYIGPAVATQILVQSTLRERIELFHLDTNAHTDISTVGRFTLRNVPRHLRVFVRFSRLLHDCSPDVVLVPISQSTLGFLKDSLFVFIAQIRGKRVLLQLRGSNFRNWLGRQPAVVRAYVLRTMKVSEGIVVLGATLRALFEDLYERDRIFVVPNGANFDLPARERSEADEVRVLYLGNLQESKGIEDVLGAIVELQKQGLSRFRLDVVGAWRDAGTQRRCTELVRTTGAPVHFHGSLVGAAKLRFLVDADVFVFTPRAPEGHPWVIVEALAAGLPVIATDQGAIAESVIDGQNGFIVGGRRPDEIANRLRLLIDDTALRQRFGAASRSRYLKEFTEDRMVGHLCAALEAAGKRR